MTNPALKYRPLGATGLQISEISFGAGPIAALMTGGALELQRKTIQRALEVGINWFDTAAAYGNGQSETNLGAALKELGAANQVHVATKVRLTPEHLSNVKESVLASVAASLHRLGLARITLLQLHNSITRNRGDEPTSVTPRDVLGQDGVLSAFEKLKADGRVEFFGLTGLGHEPSLREVIVSGPWATIQIPFNVLGPRRHEADLIAACSQRGLPVLAIRVLAGGALAGQPPSQHTLTTKFFPLALYQADQEKAERLARLLPSGMSVKEAAIRYVLSDADITTALIGFAGPEQIDEAVRFAAAGPFNEDLASALNRAARSGPPQEQAPA
ncbi:MAG: hypothetical protein DME26_09965 [Verrucomicrobia bacterium]|nr:MAG: hypothetical protein DME26_09965 [Verrucomicrobiota bacterium]